MSESSCEDCNATSYVNEFPYKIFLYSTDDKIPLNGGYAFDCFGIDLLHLIVISNIQPCSAKSWAIELKCCV